MDEEAPVQGHSVGHTTAMNVNPPFFVGGVAPERSSTAYANIVRIRSSYFLFPRNVYEDMTNSKISQMYFRVSTIRSMDV